MANIVKKFSGLPLGVLISTPLIEVAKGQTELCNVYLNYLFKLAYKDGKQNGEINKISFNLERPVTDGTGHISKQTVNVEAPLLSLVPIPAFVMDEATVDFTMTVQEQVVNTSTNTASLTTTLGGSLWGVTASISGTVTATKGQQRTTDDSATYHISARAVQQAPSEGMAKLTSLFASVIEPINVGGSK